MSRTSRQKHLRPFQSFVRNLHDRPVLAVALIVDQTFLGRLARVEGIRSERSVVTRSAIVARGLVVPRKATLHVVIFVGALAVSPQLSPRVEHLHRPILVHRGDGDGLEIVVPLVFKVVARLHVDVLVDASRDVAQLLAARLQFFRWVPRAASRQEQVLVIARPQIGGQGQLSLQVRRGYGEVPPGRLFGWRRLQGEKRQICQ